jgi:HEAT repeat protein
MKTRTDDSIKSNPAPAAPRAEGRSRNIPELLADLAKSDIISRQQARENLAKIGEPALPALIDGLDNGQFPLRWEIAKTMGEMRLQGSIPALIKALEDDEQDVRWLAATALAKIGREALPPLLEVLIARSDSQYIRQGTHLVLATYQDPQYGELLTQVRDTLSPMENPEDVIPVAQEALRTLRP